MGVSAGSLQLRMEQRENASEAQLYDGKNLISLTRSERRIENQMEIYCFECGLEVSESQQVFRNGRIFCSQSHAASTRQTPAPPQVKSASKPKPAQNPTKPIAQAQAATSRKAENPPAAPGKTLGKT